VSRARLEPGAPEYKSILVPLSQHVRCDAVWSDGYFPSLALLTCYHLPVYLKGRPSLGPQEPIVSPLPPVPPFLPASARPAYSSTLKMEAAGSSETSLKFCQTARHHVAEDTTLHTEPANGGGTYLHTSPRYRMSHPQTAVGETEASCYTGRVSPSLLILHLQWERVHVTVRCWRRPSRFHYKATIFMNSTVLWDIMPCSPLSVNRRFGGTYRLHLQGRKNNLSNKPTWKHERSLPVYCSDYFSTLKMEAIYSSETSVDSQRATRRYIPEDRTLHNSPCLASEPAGTL
jgi:hypothetical protein